MGYNFKQVDRETAYLLPPNMREWLPAKHLAWFVVDAVDTLDLKKFYLAYRSDGWGRAAYEPKMMTGLLMYSYCLGEQSSREIEKACEVDVTFRVVAGNARPDHTAICRFRQGHEEALKGLFLEVLLLCQASGLVKAGAVALDGTKMRANAAVTEDQIIVAAEVTQECNDVGQLLPMLDKVAENLKTVGADVRDAQLAQALEERQGEGRTDLGRFSARTTTFAPVYA